MHDFQGFRSARSAEPETRARAIRAMHAHALALGARCGGEPGAAGHLAKLLRTTDLSRRLAQMDRDLRSFSRRLSALEEGRAYPGDGSGLFAKAGFDPDEPRDSWGRWTDGGAAVPPASRRGPFGIATRSPFLPAIDRPGRDRPILTPAAGGEGEREDLDEDFVDPGAETRKQIFYTERDKLIRIDPVNPLIEMIVPDNWVPSGRDVGEMMRAYDVAKEAKRLEETGEPPKTIWELGWGERGREAERRRGTSLPFNYPTIDRFENGIITSIKSIDLYAPSYQNPVKLEGRINYYVNRLANFNGDAAVDGEVPRDEIKYRSLELIIPRGSLTEEREETIGRARMRAEALRVSISTIEY